MKGFAVQQSQVIADQEVEPNFTVSAQACVSAAPNPIKKKRSLPGNPDPNAEVIILSPKSLLATNRFACEVCGKGFQREQNLQLHRRGHNLPWKLKQRANNEVVRKKVYVCPEPSCDHHDPSRALGDLTGIKKHFFRKHGEKKWNCERCSKKYAVLSDWKAHAKVCGTKEYRCDCGTVFSRRDSFITHRAFCDVLTAEESARSTTARAHPFASTGQQINYLLLPQHTTLLQPSEASSSSSNAATISSSSSLFGLRQQEIPQWPASAHVSLINQQVDQHSPLPPTFPSLLQATKPSPHLSATALLQKAAQMGATMSRSSDNHDGLFSLQQEMGGVFGIGTSAASPLVQEMMVGSSFPSCSGLGGFFEETMGEFLVPKREEGFGGGGEFMQGRSSQLRSVEGGSGGVSDGMMTRDFLGSSSFDKRLRRI